MAILLKPGIAEIPCTDPATAEPHADHDGMALSGDETIICRIASHIERFVFFQSRPVYQLVATWCLATHLHPAFEYFPYLFACSPEPQSGKSRLLEVLHPLVFNSSGILVEPTTAVLFRTAEKSTQLLDEIDTWLHGESFRGVLNAGFRNGAVVKRNERELEGKYQIQDFNVYCPRALAGLRTRILNSATLTRTFVINMVRQKKSERRERLRGKQKEFEAIKAEITEWVKVNSEAIIARYNDGAFDYLEQFSDRTRDISEPLAAVHEIAYLDHPRAEEMRYKLIEAIAEACQEQDALIPEMRVLREFARLADEQPGHVLVGSATELAEMCKGLPEPPNGNGVSQVLRRYGFETKSTRIDGGQPKYRYCLPAEKLADIVARYEGMDSGNQ